MPQLVGFSSLGAWPLALELFNPPIYWSTVFQTRLRVTGKPILNAATP